MDKEISCRVCRQCNRKGRPSVMRGSSYCDANQIRIGIFGQKKKKKGLLSRLRERFYNARTVEDKETKQVKEFRTRGFRESWFYRD